MKRKRRKEWKKRIGKKILKSIMTQDHEVTLLVCAPLRKVHFRF